VYDGPTPHGYALAMEKAPNQPTNEETTMISFMRTASIAAGKTVDAITFAHQITKFLAEKHDLKVAICLPIGGNPNRIGWHTMYPSLAELEVTTVKLMADPEYMALITANAGNMIAGSLHDDIWRVL
jgi:hypothetical protein